ncbi:chromosome segregation protein ScpA [bacterium]|nr:chromosome segregation protein ScpA [bacterium]
MVSQYRVELDVYSGPLDLLLYLVRRNELPITELPLSRITHQYLKFLDVLKFLDLDGVGDFVVLASTLIEIKSRLVLPQADEEDEAESISDDDAKSELITRLLQYKRYKEAASALEDRAAEWQQRFPRLSDERPQVGRDHAADPIREVELWDLVSALSRVLQKKVVEETSAIRYDETPIATYADRIATRVKAEGRVAFSSLFDGTNERSRIVGIFLAILELLRHHGYHAEQPDAYGEIFVLPPIENAETGEVLPHVS